jgi:pimeloyl-ACP methyl ester carboxylesterase
MKHLMFALVAGVACTGAALADPAVPVEKPKVDPLYLPYETPGVFAKLSNGDTIHIKCMGTGSPTVILSAGMGDWSDAWRKVQPQIAKTTRVCAWDRPGFGFSSGSTRPQTTANTTADLEAALKVAHIGGPYVAVGHSLGGYETLLFKDDNPQAVVGMVLVDPSIPDQLNRFHAVSGGFSDGFNKYLSDQSKMLGRCVAGLKSGKLKPGLPDPDGCLSYPPDYPPQVAAALIDRDTNPLRLTAFRSLTDNFTGDSASLVRPNRNYGSMPLIVLTATKPQALPPGTPQAAADAMPKIMKELARAHDELAALSSRGVNRMIADSTHYVQYDQPHAVIDAVNEVVAAARER